MPASIFYIFLFFLFEMLGFDKEYLDIECNMIYLKKVTNSWNIPNCILFKKKYYFHPQSCSHMLFGANFYYFWLLPLFNQRYQRLCSRLSNLSQTHTCCTGENAMMYCLLLCRVRTDFGWIEGYEGVSTAEGGGDTSPHSWPTICFSIKGLSQVVQ